MIRQLLSVGGVNLLAKLLAIAAGVLVVRGLSQTEYARFATAQAVYSLVVAVVFTAYNLQLVRMVGQAAAAHQDRRPLPLLRGFVLLTLLTYLPILLAGTCLAEPLARWLLHDAGFAAAIRWGCWAGAAMVLGNLGLYIQQAELDYRGYNRQNLVRHALLLPGVALVFALGWHDHRWVMAVFLLAQLLPALTYFLARRNRPLWQLRAVPLGEVTRHLHGVRGLLLYYVLWSAFDQLGVFLLGRLSTNAELANYGLAFRNYVSLVLVLVSIQAVLLPRMARTTSDPAAQRAFLQRWFVRTAWTALPLAVAAAVAKPLWVALFGGYAEAYGLFCLLLAGAWAHFVFGPAFSLLLSQGRYGWLLASAVLALGCIIASAFWIKTYGALAAAAGTAAGATLGYGLLYAAARRKATIP